jgi:alpha-beta hydrolase superfamily lysophospholipase
MSVVSETEGTWVEQGTGRAFGYRAWQPDIPRERLVIVHGFGEHGGRYGAFAAGLARQGIWVVAPDLWGHGRSGGPRGDVRSVGECVSSFEAMARELFGSARYTVFGHSFGALVAVHWALGQPEALCSLIAQSPLIEVGFRIPSWKSAAVAVLGTCWPAFGLSMGLDVDALSHDPSVASAYRADPLVHDRMSAGAYHALRSAAREAIRRAPELRTPCLFLCGTEDRIVSVEAASRWFDLVAARKSRVIFPGCYHELHHEAVRDEVLRLVSGWVLDHAAR